MHMDVKEPAKLGVRFNWCKCVSGGWQPSLHCDVAQAGREGSACTTPAPLPGQQRGTGSTARGKAPLATSVQHDRVMAKGQDRHCD